MMATPRVYLATHEVGRVESLGHCYRDPSNLSLVVKIYLNCPFPFNLKQRKEKEAQGHIISPNSPYGAAGGSAQFLFVSPKNSAKSLIPLTGPPEALSNFCKATQGYQ